MDKYPSFRALMAGIAAAMGRIREEERTAFNGKIAALQARLDLLEVQLDAVARIEATAGRATAAVGATDARLDRLSEMFETLIESADPAKVRNAAARLRQ